MESVISPRKLSQISVLTKIWLSETAFITDEIRFLSKLVNHQTLFASDETDLGSLQELTKELAAVKIDVEHVKKDIQDQFHLIYDITANKNSKGSATLGNSHEILEEHVASLTKRFRGLKSNVLKNAARMLEQKPENEV